MKVFLQVIDKRIGIYQTGMIEEPVINGKEIDNALAHFGVSNGTVSWKSKYQSDNIINRFGEVEGTSKVVSVVAIE